jgi:hypothetical protein
MPGPPPMLKLLPQPEISVGATELNRLFIRHGKASYGQPLSMQSRYPKQWYADLGGRPSVMETHM